MHINNIVLPSGDIVVVVLTDGVEGDVEVSVCVAVIGSKCGVMVAAHISLT